MTIRSGTARAYTIPTDAPEADGTMAWDSTTLVVVELHASEMNGIGYTYAHRTAAFVAAYHAVYPLLAEEIDILFDLIALRQAMTVTITEWRATLYPDNKAYILRNHPRAAAALDVLDRIGRVDGTARLRQACDME